MKVVIACGGTGGHLFPGLAVAEVLHARGHEVLIFISEKEIDSLAVTGRTEFRFEKLPSVGLPSPFSPAILRFLRRFNDSLSLCRSTYRKFKPDAVLGMGGFTSTAPVLAGRMRRIPSFVHESNAIPGKANRMTARLVRAVLLGFPECAKYFPRVATEVTGTPIRSSLVRVDRAGAREKLGLAADKPTVLIMGGSQGATGINQAVIKSMAALRDFPLQIIHLSGSKDERLLADNYRRENIAAHVTAFHHSMEELYSAADLVVARSGAASLAEIAAFELPSILVPYPHAAEDHQTRNAEIFARANAAIVLKESDLAGDILAGKIRELLNDPASLRTMAENAGRLAPKNAADQVADAIERHAQTHSDARA